MAWVMAHEVTGDEIAVKCVAPGAIQAKAEDHHDPAGFQDVPPAFQAVKARGSAADVARAVVFFTASENGFVTGQTLIVDGSRVMQ